jgi:putative transcriptional regulator
MFHESEEDSFRIPGSLMLAHPHLTDPNFARSVILMTAHEEAGSLGVVVNKFSGQKLGEVDGSFGEYGLENIPLYIGGPVATDRVILGGWKIDPELGSFKLFFGLEPALAASKLEEDPNISLRAFRGYAGWAKGQLEDELSNNAWVVSEMDSQALSQLEGDELWRHVIININLELGLMSLAPEHPEVN